MKNLFIFILLLPFFTLFINCEHEEGIKLFPPEKLSELSLDNIDNFWANDTIDNISDYVTENFHVNPGHLASIRYSSKKGKDLSVSVFKSQKIAIEAMEERRNNVACVIETGTSDVIKGTWWFTDCIPNSVFVNQWNTIIEVSYYHDNYEEIENILYSTANELANRVDKLSE
jgi:hypothetical protein